MIKFTETYNQEIKNISKKCSVISFCIGTLIFIIFLINKNDSIIMFGLYYTIIAVILNSFLLLLNIIGTSFNNNLWLQYVKNCAIISVNLPIAVLYFHIVLKICGF